MKKEQNLLSKYYKRQNTYFSDVDGAGTKEEVYDRLEETVKKAYKKKY